MHRIALDPNPGPSDLLSPDMTVNDAAEAMERFHRSVLLVGREKTPLGIVSEMDIVSKVLAAGLDPSKIPLEAVMTFGHVDRQGAFLIEDDLDLASPLWGSESLSSREDEEERLLTEILQGKCEECGGLSSELHDGDGLLICDDCSQLRRTIFS